MNGETPETWWAVIKRQDNKQENCCIYLVIYLNCAMIHGLTSLKLKKKIVLLFPFPRTFCYPEFHIIHCLRYLHSNTPVRILATWNVFIYVSYRIILYFQVSVGNTPLRVVTENRHHDRLHHVAKIFLRHEPLTQCFPPCTTRQNEREFHEYATM
jgi:hypothetical protein